MRDDIHAALVALTTLSNLGWTHGDSLAPIRRTAHGVAAVESAERLGMAARFHPHRHVLAGKKTVQEAALAAAAFARRAARERMNEAKSVIAARPAQAEREEATARHYERTCAVAWAACMKVAMNEKEMVREAA